MAYLEQPEIDVKPACIWYMQEYCSVISEIGSNSPGIDSEIEEMGHYFWDEYYPVELKEDINTYFGISTGERLLRWTESLASLTINVDSYSFGPFLRELGPQTLARITEEARFLAMAKPDPTNTFDYLLADYSFRIRLLELVSEEGQGQVEVRHIREGHNGTWICRTGNYQESTWFNRIVKQARADSGCTVKYHAKMFQ